MIFDPELGKVFGSQVTQFGKSANDHKFFGMESLL